MKLGKVIAVAAVATTINVAVVQDANAWSTWSTWGNTTYGFGSWGNASFNTWETLHTDGLTGEVVDLAV